MKFAGPLLLLPILAACPETKDTEAKDRALAQQLAVPTAAPLWPAKDAGKPVLLYVDRSESMRGFLDPDYPARIPTDYRSVLDGFDARMKPARVFGFGNQVREVGTGIGVLGNPEFYSDGNTQLEEVFPYLTADSTLASTHVIIGDGRRRNPNTANTQFVDMRNAADRWIAAGGTFLVAASAAPFLPVSNDPAGCRAAGSGPQTCPLYAFAFVAPGDQARVAEALAAVFEHLYVTPLPALPDSAIMMTATPSNGMTLRDGWVRSRGGVPVARVRGSAQTNQPMTASLIVRDSTSPRDTAVMKALQGQRMNPVLSVRPLSATPSPWQRVSGTASLMRQGSNAFSYEFFSHGSTAPRYLYRVELHPSGEPSWLADFDAEDAKDEKRTFGFGRLFGGFRARGPFAAPPVIQRLSVVN